MDFKKLTGKNIEPKSNGNSAPTTAEYKLPIVKFAEEDIDPAFVEIGKALCRIEYSVSMVKNGFVKLDEAWQKYPAFLILDSWMEISFDESLLTQENKKKTTAYWLPKVEGWRKEYPKPFTGKSAYLVQFEVNMNDMELCKSNVSAIMGIDLKDLESTWEARHTQTPELSLYEFLVGLVNEHNLDVKVTPPLGIGTRNDRNGKPYLALQYLRWENPADENNIQLKPVNVFSIGGFTLDKQKELNEKVYQKYGHYTESCKEMGYVICDLIQPQPKATQYFEIKGFVDLWV